MSFTRREVHAKRGGGGGGGGGGVRVRRRIIGGVGESHDEEHV